MAKKSVPIVFLSHSHSDKRVARRLVRRLTAHGVKVWLDERELRLGDTLTESLRMQIHGANMMLVVASHASAVSKWVGLELQFAQEQGKPIIPLFIEPLANHDRFRNCLGIDATSPQMFADAVYAFLRELFKSYDMEMPPADPAVLEAGLRDWAKEEPDLEPLILGCLDSEGLHQENLDTVFKTAFHPLDDALNALFDLMPKDRIAHHAACGFSWAGAGSKALFSWIAATGHGDLPIVSAVGDRLDPLLIDTAINLLKACSPPNNHALYNFIDRNASQFTQEQRRKVLRLVTWPVRENPDRLADVLGLVAIKHFPDAVEIQQMWSRWINSGGFDGKVMTPTDLARYLADAHKERLPGWERINEALRSHVRSYIRSGDKAKIGVAVEHLRAAADKGAPALQSLLCEIDGASGTCEWRDWKKHDRDTADQMEMYVSAIVSEARGDRNWLRAMESFKKMVALDEQYRHILTKLEKESNRDE